MEDILDLAWHTNADAASESHRGAIQSRLPCGFGCVYHRDPGSLDKCQHQIERQLDLETYRRDIEWAEVHDRVVGLPDVRDSCRRALVG